MREQIITRISTGALLLALCIALAVPHSQASQQTAQDELARGAQAFTSGRFALAVAHWSSAADLAAALGATELQIEALARRGEAYQALGYLSKSKADLTEALALAQTDSGDVLMARLRGGLGNAHSLSGDPDAARSELSTALAHARAAGNETLEARTLNNLGNLALFEGHFDQAAELYNQSRLTAGAAGDLQLQATATLNEAHALAALNDPATATARLEVAIQALTLLPDSSAKAQQLISAGQLALSLEQDARQSLPALRESAYRALSDARQTATAIGDARSQSYALGSLGRLYERAERWDEALGLTRQALFLAQEINAPEILYLWQWQVGRIKRAQGDRPAAIQAYQGAVATLRSIQADMVSSFDRGQASFDDSIRPVILGLADLQLQAAQQHEDPTQTQALLREARRTVELLKAAELEDYFNDSCVAALRAKERPIDQMAPGTAALYPIILPDRLELLLSLPDGLTRTSVPVPERQIQPVIGQFRRLLEKRTTRQYLTAARQLHGWLIAPIEGALTAHQVTTLVVVPSGALSTIPFAALHDGEAHLVERMAVAVVPGLTLLEPRPIERQDAAFLLSGLTESVQGFPSLPYVDAELSNVQEIFGGTLFKDQDFLLINVKEELERSPYTVVHVASHAQIEPNVADSFLLAYDGKLTMDGLEEFVKLSRFRNEPIELLTLSACSTAGGDVRAALGLAGIGIKAGARSALASLWFINDESTARLVSAFYRELERPETSKAEALRQAQLSLLTTYRTRHPGYWAPFLLIGNWL